LKAPAVPDDFGGGRQVFRVGIDSAGQSEVDKGSGRKQQENKKEADKYIVRYFHRPAGLGL
jgi:hypothetical protein